MTVVRVCDTLQGNSAVAMTPVSIATTTDKSGPNLQLALQLLVLFYIIKQLLHTPSLNSVFITTQGVYIPRGQITLFNEGVCNNCIILHGFIHSHIFFPIIRNIIIVIYR